MKTRFIIIIWALISLGQVSFAQERLPLVREGVEWGYCAAQPAHSSEGGWYINRLYYRLQFNGDTIVDGKTYKKLYKYDTKELDTSVTPCEVLMREEGNDIYVRLTAPYLQSEWHNAGLLVECSDTKECLTYRYSEDGDILQLYPEDPYYNFPEFLRKDNLVNVGGVECDQYYNEYNELYITGVGPVNLHNYSDVGTIAFPFVSVTTGYHSFRNYLLYLRDLDGNMLYKSPNYDEYAFADPTLNERLPLVREGVEWGYCAEQSAHTPEGVWYGERFYYRLQFKGDTIVDGNTYKKLYKYETAELDTSVTPCEVLMREEGNDIYVRLTKPYEEINFWNWYNDGPMARYSDTEECVAYRYSEDGGILQLYPEGYYENFPEFLRKDNPVNVGGVECDQYYDMYNELYITGVGPVNLKGSEMIGNFAFPYVIATTGYYNFRNYILYIREVGGDITYKSASYDELASADPTLDEYMPLLREDMEWGYYSEYKSAGEDGEAGNYYRMQFKGDTIIDNLKYKKLYVYQTDVLNVKNTPCYLAMRQDESGIYTRVLNNDAGYDKIFTYLPASKNDFEYMPYLYDAKKNCWKIGAFEDGERYTFEYDCTVVADCFERRTYEYDASVFIEGIGMIIPYLNGGNLAFPIMPSGNGVIDKSYLMYIREVCCGRIRYVTPNYDKYASGDPTLNGIEAVGVDSYDGKVEYFDLQGRKVTHPTNGVYIKKGGNSTEKVLIY